MVAATMTRVEILTLMLEHARRTGDVQVWMLALAELCNLEKEP